MDTATESAFNDAATGIFEASDLQFLFTGIVFAIAFSYVVWIAIRAYGEFGERQLDSVDVFIYVLRAVVVLTVVTAFITI